MFKCSCVYVVVVVVAAVVVVVVVIRHRVFTVSTHVTPCYRYRC